MTAVPQFMWKHHRMVFLCMFLFGVCWKSNMTQVVWWTDMCFCLNTHMEGPQADHTLPWSGRTENSRRQTMNNCLAGGGGENRGRYLWGDARQDMVLHIWEFSGPQRPMYKRFGYKGTRIRKCYGPEEGPQRRSWDTRWIFLFPGWVWDACLP